jgi:hypothetical protein
VPFDPKETNPPEPLVRSRTILRLGGAYLGLALLFWAVWIWSGDFAPVADWFAYCDPPFLVGMALLEFLLASQAAGQFEPGEPLRTAWKLISAGAGLQAASLLLGHWLGVKIPINPIVWSGNEVPQWVKPAGLFLGGAPTMAILAIGLWRVVRLYRSFDLRQPLGIFDKALLTAACVYTVFTLGVVVRLMLMGQKTAGFTEMLSWTADPLLCVLLFEALILRRSVRMMSGGLVANCWFAFVVAIALTIAGDISIWAEAYQIVPWPWRSLLWYVWYGAAIAFTVAPAYQLEAIARAYLGSRDAEEPEIFALV